MKPTNTIVPTTLQVIEHRLLTSLQEDRSRVACLFERQDLNDLIVALQGYKIGILKDNILSWQEHESRCQRLATGLEELRDAAFPSTDGTPHNGQNA